MSDTDSDTASSVGSIHEDASEPDTTSFKDLFSDKQFGRVEDMITHNKTEYGFDLSATIKNLGPGTSAQTSTPASSHQRRT
jgi:protein arginine N-methyltransferase 3